MTFDSLFAESAESVAHTRPAKKIFLKISQNCIRPPTLSKKRSPTQVFSCEF